jgi:hypothetical protein
MKFDREENENWKLQNLKSASMEMQRKHYAVKFKNKQRDHYENQRMLT